MSDNLDGLRDQLENAIWPAPLTDEQAATILDRLLPVVAAWGRQQAADALRDAADDLHVRRFNADPDPAYRWPEGARREPDTFYAGIVRACDRLGARADELLKVRGRCPPRRHSSRA